MKKLIFTLLFCISLCGCRSSCDSSHHWYADNGKIKVLSTTAMIGDLVCAIGGEQVDPIVLIAAGIDPHSYELVKGDDEKIQAAELLIGNGLNLEHGASLKFQLAEHKNALLLGEEIRERVPSKILYTDGELDPHLWMDISLWSEGITPIAEALSQLDPEHCDLFTERAEALRSTLLSSHHAVRDQLHSIPEKNRFLVTSHDAFHYFTRAYLSEGGEWETRCMAPEGLAPEGQMSGRDLQRVVDHLCVFHIGVVFPESNVSPAALKKIVSSCNSHGHDVRVCSMPLYGDSMGVPGSGADTYVGMIRHNADILEKELSRG